MGDGPTLTFTPKSGLLCFRLATRSVLRICTACRKPSVRLRSLCTRSIRLSKALRFWRLSLAFALARCAISLNTPSSPSSFIPIEAFWCISNSFRDCPPSEPSRQSLAITQSTPYSCAKDVRVKRCARTLPCDLQAIRSRHVDTRARCVSLLTRAMAE